MNAPRWWSLALSVGLIGATLGCAQGVPTTQPPEAFAPADTMGTLPPESVILGDRQISANGQTMTLDQIRKLLPARLTPAEASKLLVSINPDRIDPSGSQEVQVRGFGRGYGGYGRGYGRGYGGYGFHRGFWPGFGARYRYGAYGYYPYGGYYFPYAYNAGYYTPYCYPYAGATYYPFLYGYGNLYNPFYCWQ